MTVSTTSSRIEYLGNGITSAFAIPFRFLENSHIRITRVELDGSQTMLSPGADYTLVGDDADDGGVANLTVAPPNGVHLIILRVVPATQETDYISGDPFPAESHERALDKLTMLAQQGEEVDSRTLKFPVGDLASQIGDLPPAALRVNSLLAFDAFGRPSIAVPSSQSAAGLQLLLAGQSGSAQVGFIQSGAGSVPRTSQAKLRERVSVLDKGAVGDGAADDTLAIQRAFDEHPGAEIDFCGRQYRCTGPIYLSDLTGRQFKGSIKGSGATVTFTNAGNAADADKDMQHGFSAMATLLVAGADNSGTQRISVEGLTVNGPLHGAAMIFTNSILNSIKSCRFDGVRYGVAMDGCINFTIEGNQFHNHCNAGVGMLLTNDPARVWYTVAGPAAAHWNDGHRIISNAFTSDALNQPLAHILDHGSTSLSVRVIDSNVFYSRWDGVGNRTGVQYGYLGRKCDPTITRNWFENVNYPVRLMNTNAVEGGGNITSVAGAEPGGVYPMNRFPEGFCYNTIIEGNYTARAFVDYNVSGVNKSARVGHNISSFMANGGSHVLSIVGGDQRILDMGNSIISPVGTFAYASLTAPTRTDLAADWVNYVPTVGPSAGSGLTYTINAARYLKRSRDVMIRLDITITNNGTGSGRVEVQPPFVGTQNAGILAGREVVTTGAAIVGTVNAGVIIVTKPDNTYPGATGHRLVMSGIYESTT